MSEERKVVYNENDGSNLSSGKADGGYETIVEQAEREATDA